MKQKLFPPEPAIEFKQFNKFSSDSTGTPTLTNAECIIKFKDGDGDIGIVKGDNSSAPDLKMVYQYDSAGVFVPFNDSIGSSTIFDTAIYWFSVPDITPQGQYKALEGEILIKMKAPFAAPFHSVFRYGITLTDRSGHVSNLVYTDPISNTP